MHVTKIICDFRGTPIRDRQAIAHLRIPRPRVAVRERTPEPSEDGAVVVEIRHSWLGMGSGGAADGDRFEYHDHHLHAPCADALLVQMTQIRKQLDAIGFHADQRGSDA